MHNVKGFVALFNGLSLISYLHGGAHHLRQDSETGGFADRPGDIVDPFHTVFGLAALSMLEYPTPTTLAPVNSIFCMTKDVLPAHVPDMK